MLFLKNQVVLVIYCFMYVVYHVYRPFICEKTPDGEIYADL